VTVSERARKVVSVARIGEYVKSLLDGNPWLRDVAVRGELAEYEPKAGATIRFRLKDQQAQLACVAWAKTAAAFPKVRNGQSVVVSGNLSAYPKDGIYQLVATALRYDGVATS
jgi:exodeoxyribonuclease VII large subunit